MLQEFFEQGDRERAQGMPVSPMMDRENTSPPLSQINFIEFIVAPLFAEVRLGIALNTGSLSFCSAVHLAERRGCMPCSRVSDSLVGVPRHRQMC